MSQVFVHRENQTQLRAILFQEIQNYITERENDTFPIVFGAPGGRSVELLSQLSSLRIKESTRQRIHFIPIDTYQPSALRIDDNFRSAWDSFLASWYSNGIILPENIHSLPFSEHMASESLMYAEELLTFLRGIDVLFLGSGGGHFQNETSPPYTEDTGHVMGIMPGFPRLWEMEKQWVSYSQDLKPPSIRMSLTPYAVKTQPDLVIAAVLGAGKANVMKHWDEGKLTEIEQPLCMIKNIRGKAILLTDNL